MSEKLQASRETGPHSRLAALVGEWEGAAKTWFEPGNLADTSPISGTIRSALDGRFVVHEYQGTLSGHEMVGIQILGWSIGKGCYTQAWVDSCHNGTDIMCSEGQAGRESPISVLGGYTDYGSGTRWGWRVQADVEDADHIVISHFNIAPTGQEAIGVEIRYTRKV